MEEAKKCRENEKCEICNEESLKLGLCLKCNNEKGYYSFKNHLLDINNNFIDCINNKSKPENYYFNIEKNSYEECYETCKSCDFGGDRNQNNCTLCENKYIFEPEKIKTKNCVLKCPNFYYYTSYGRYKCSIMYSCPEESNLLIIEKKKCIDNCKNDNLYKYQYNGICLKECPNNTKILNEDYNICKDININQCILSENELFFKDITENEINYLIRNYVKEFNYTNNHISKFKNNIYSILIYKNRECISHLSLEEPEIDFGECYKKVKNENKINDNLIIVIITKINDLNYRKIMSYLMYEPIYGDKLIINDICENDLILMKENLFIKLNYSIFNIDINDILYLSKQDINIFNLSSSFYTDICYHFDYPINKDISLKDRIKLYYPNISLCENDCLIKGVNLTNLEAICECKFNFISNNIITNNLFFKNNYEEVQEFISQTNIQIIKCYEDIFNIKYYKDNIGGIIIIILIIVEMILTIIYSSRSLYLIRKYLYELSAAYILYVSNKKNILSNINLIYAPPIKKINKKKNYKKMKLNNSNSNEKKIKINSSKKVYPDKLIINNLSEDNSIKKVNISNDNLKVEENIKHNSKSKRNNIYIKNSFSHNINIIINQKDELKYNIEEYMKTELDEMDYDNAIKKDKRKFCEYFCNKLKVNQIILNTFCNNEPLRPKPIKILLFILDIALFLFINALFINENYISEVFNSNKEEKFFTFILRSYNRFLYATLVGVIVNYIIDCFFIDEKKIKGIFKREKDNMVILKYEISKIATIIKRRNILFIILTYIISIFILYYIFCFNNIYPHMKIEWLKSSIIIIIIMQIIYVLECLFETIIRFISFKLKSERIYKISLLFA